MAQNWLDRNTNRDRAHFGRRPSWAERRREQTLLEWYGPEAGRLEILAHQSGARPLHDVVENVVDSLSRRRDPALERIRGMWAGIVGADVARNSRPVRIAGTCLYVEVQAGPWMYALQIQNRRAVEAELQRATQGLLRTLRCVPGGGTLENAMHFPRPPVPEGSSSPPARTGPAPGRSPRTPRPNDGTPPASAGL